MSLGSPKRPTRVLASCWVRTAWILQPVAGHLGHHGARANDVDGHAARRELQGHGLRQGNDGALRGAVGGVQRRCEGAYRRDIDDPPPLPLQHQRRDGLAGEESALDVHRHDEVPLLLVDAQDPAGHVHTGVVDQDVRLRRTSSGFARRSGPHRPPLRRRLRRPGPVRQRAQSGQPSPSPCPVGGPPPPPLRPLGRMR